MGIHILVATPGRLSSLLKFHEIKLGQVSCLVLDEADRMSDPCIKNLVAALPIQHQTYIFAAVYCKNLRQIAMELTSQPVSILVGAFVGRPLAETTMKQVRS